MKRVDLLFGVGALVLTMVGGSAWMAEQTRTGTFSYTRVAEAPAIQRSARITKSQRSAPKPRLRARSLDLFAAAPR